MPRAPSATVMNIAQALIGKRHDRRSRSIGIGPGEKMHEIMVSEEEIHHCVRRGDYYAIRPMLPELRGDATRRAERARRRSSARPTPCSTSPDTVALLEAHRLMVDERRQPPRGELLR